MTGTTEPTEETGWCCPGPSRWAAGWARSLLRALETPAPWAPRGPQDTLRAGPDEESLRPRATPGWHSSAPMEWASLVLLRVVPDELGPQLCRALTGQLRRRWRGGAARVEADQLRCRPDAGRPFDWAWTALLAAEARGNGVALAHGWDRELVPLAGAVEDRLLRALASGRAPVRTGTDENTALCTGMLLDALTALGMTGTAETLADRARGWFCGQERSSSAADPCTQDICSPALAQADLVRRLLPPEAFGAWLAAFLPRLGSTRDETLRLPVVHGLSGGTQVLPTLALTRALHLRHLAPRLPRARR